MKTQDQIGAQIAHIRESQGMTQAELAKKLKTTQSAIARMESGNQNVSAEMLKKLSQALKKNLITLSPGTMNLEIVGGKKLHGSVTTSTSKNGAVGLLCASLLNTGKTILKNMPRIEEVHRIIEVLESIGVRVEWHGADVTIVRPQKLRMKSIDRVAATKTRSIIMCIGPLIHQMEHFSLPQSGGCKLGSRTVRPHFYALEHFGTKIEATEHTFEVTTHPVCPSEIILYESGDTVTENALMAAALAPCTTVIKYASANYQVQELCAFLALCGVRIEGVGTTTLTVTGVSKIHEDIEYTLSEDPTDSMFFLATAILTHSQITIKRCPIDFLEIELLKLEKMGFRYRKSEVYRAHNGMTRLVDITTYPSKLVALHEKIHPAVYPGLNIDNLPFFAVIATVAEGQTLIHDWVYEKRALYFTELDRLGAETVLADPHRIYITGPSKLHATELICPPALRPATILLIAMLGAKGRSVLRNIYSINRGYENLVERLSQLGADIHYLEEF